MKRVALDCACEYSYMVFVDIWHLCAYNVGGRFTGSDYLLFVEDKVSNPFGVLKNWYFLLTSIEEQRRIVAKIDELMSAISR